MTPRRGRSVRPSHTEARSPGRGSAVTARPRRAGARSSQAGALKTLLIGLLLAIGSFLFGMLVISPLIDALHPSGSSEAPAVPAPAPNAQPAPSAASRPAQPPSKPELQVTPEPGPAATVQQPETPDGASQPPAESNPAPGVTATPEIAPATPHESHSVPAAERSSRRRRHPSAEPPSSPPPSPSGGVQQGEPIN